EPPLRSARLRADATRHRDARDVCRPRRLPSLRPLLDAHRPLQLLAPARPPARDRTAGDAGRGMTALRVAGWSNLAIGLLHLIALPWERRMSYWVGIGPAMDRLEHRHFLLPYAMWIAAAAAFGACGLYTLSAAGSSRSVPLTRAAIVVVTCIYVVRAVGGS